MKRLTSATLLLIMTSTASAVPAAETRLYWRDRCLISSDGTENRFFAAVLTLVATFAVNKAIEYVKSKLDGEAKDKTEEVSASRSIYLFRRGPEGIVATESVGCLILVKGTFDDSSGEVYAPFDAMQDTFSLPARFNDVIQEKKGPEWIKNRLKANGIPVTAPDIVYEVEIERQPDLRSISLVNRRLWTAASEGKVKYASRISLQSEGVPIFSHGFEIGKTFQKYEAGDILPDWKDEQKVERSDPKSLAIPSSQTKLLIDAVSSAVERQKLIGEARAAYRVAKDDDGRQQIARRIQDLALPQPSVFTFVTAEVKLLVVKEGSRLAKELSAFVTDSKKDLAKEIVGVIPLPSAAEAKAKKAEEEKQKAIASVQAACAQWLVGRTGGSSDQLKLQLKDQRTAAEKAGAILTQVIVPACMS